MPSYTLVYFNARGLAEIARLMFAAAGVEYEDKRITKEDWVEMKEQMPFGQVPILHVDDDVIFQSNAINRYLAREFGFYGDSNIEAARIDSICECWRDVLECIFRFMREEDSEIKEKLRDLAVTKIIPGFLTLLEARLCLNEDGEGYFVGDKLSMADIASYHILSSVLSRFPGLLDNFEKLKAYVDRIGEEENIKNWVESRPESEF